MRESRGWAYPPPAKSAPPSRGIIIARRTKADAAIQGNVGRPMFSGLLRRCAPRKDDSIRMQPAPL
jgi:hypothetical protein